jgi:hypothetical protein
MDYGIIQGILKALKIKKGANIYDLIKLAPHLAGYADVSPVDFLSDELRELARWGLVEIYKGTRLVSAEKIRSFNDPNLEVYLSPFAIRLETSLNISLTATSIWGEAHKSQYLPDLFVLMPFAPGLRPVYDDHIKKVASGLGLSAARGDDFFSKGSIMHDVWSAIYYARVIIADCTKRNPNVFYEIGIAHTLGKDTILISQAVKDIPFDLRHLRTIIYEDTPKGMAAFEKILKSTLRSIL